MGAAPPRRGSTPCILEIVVDRPKPVEYSYTVAIQSLQYHGLSRIRVVDNGSTDNSAAIAPDLYLFYSCAGC
jgi:glycosyltransferase involved in cell wall biosynthesis